MTYHHHIMKLFLNNFLLNNEKLYQLNKIAISGYTTWMVLTKTL